jgi:hypothetical protein
VDREQEAQRIYLRLFAWVLFFTSLSLFDFYGSKPVWPWEGLQDGGWTDGLALFLPLLGGILFFLLARVGWNQVMIAAIVLAGLGLGWVVSWWSTLAPHPLGVYDHLADGLPPLFSRAFWLLILGTGLLAAGIRLGAKGFLQPQEGRPALADPWMLARLFTGLGISLILLFYLLPYRGSVPIFSLVTGLAELSRHLDAVTGVALLAGHVLSLGPLLLALGSAVRVFRRAPEHGGMLFALLLVFLPLLCVLVGLRNFAVLPAATLLHLRSAALIMTIMAGVGLALPILVRGAWFEVPWSFGQLTLTDRMLAAALSGGESQSGEVVAKSLNRVHPLVRPFVRRRLFMWRSAAAQAGTGEAELSQVMSFLSERWKEEKKSDEELPKDWPGWMRSQWIPALAALTVALLGVLTLLAVHRAETTATWACGRERPAERELFEETLPAVISELSYEGGDVLDLDSFAQLERSLAAAEEFCPGIQNGVIDLLELGSRGRKRLHSIWRARDRLNHLLQENGVPYFVRARVRAGRRIGGGDLFYTLNYRVTDCRGYRVKATGRVFPVLHLQRADKLNVIEYYVGATDEEDPYVTILLDRVEVFLGRRMLEVVDRDDAIGDAAAQGVLAVAESLEALEEGVAGPVGQFTVEGLTRHELHHKWLGLDPEPPTALWAWMSEYTGDAVRGVAAEVGAFLGELSYDPAYARMRIAMMLDSLGSPAGHRGIHGMARVFLLGRLFEVEAAWEWRLSVPRLAAPILVVMSDADLKERIDRCHQDLFGVPAPVFARKGE